MSYTKHHSEHNSAGKRDGQTREKINKPNCLVQYRYMKGVYHAYRYLSYYSVVGERMK
jgi:hypothetical protein